MRKTKEEAAVTRNALLDAALRVFSRQGYESTRLEDIADEAGFTRGAIYHHFGGKVELYHALVSERFGRSNQMIHELIEQGGTPLEIMRRVLVRSLQYLEEDADYRAVQELVTFKTGILPELEVGMNIKKQQLEAFLGYITSLVVQGMEMGEIVRGKDPRDVAIAIIGMMNGVSLLWLFDPKLFSLKKRAEGIVDSFLGGIRS
jgi:TetR/AcrR family acrAB operon transcriptional repressor